MPVRVKSYWDPDPLLEAERLDAAADELTDFAPALAAAREIVVRDIRSHFEREETPGHKAWDKWSRDYEDRGKRENVGILQKQPQYHNSAFGPTRLVDAVTSRHSYYVTGHELFANTASWPEYWEWHHFGLPDRVHAGAARVAAEVRAGGFDATGVGENPLPERPFLGASIEAVQEITTILDEFVDGAMSIATHPRTGSTQRRGAGGRFAKGF